MASSYVKRNCKFLLNFFTGFCFPMRKSTDAIYALFQIQFANSVRRFDLDVTAFQMAVLFAWNERPNEKISLENLRLATELPDAELRRTLWVNFESFSMVALPVINQLFIIHDFCKNQSLAAFPKLKRQLLICHPEVQSPRDFTDNSIFAVNQDFSLMFVSSVQLFCLGI